MKYIFVSLAVCFCSELFAQKSVYDVEIESSKGEKIKISAFSGRKIMVAMVSLERLKEGSMKFLDSVQKRYPGMKVITIPVSTDDTSDAASIRNLDEVAKNNVSISKASKVRKTDGQRQNLLMRWLTNVTENRHFNEEVHTDEQLYFISSYGVLYAVLEKGAPTELITELLAQSDIKE